MAQPTLAELTAAAAASDGPGFPPDVGRRFGGVDPLGLRQINFDLMDEVLPGLNNVARHVRPFVVIAWAWRRANQLAQAKGYKTIRLDQLQDFVDRIEVIYVWSQLLKNKDADLPGRQVLDPIVKAPQWTFGGAKWQKRRETRENSTALSAPINYGPALRMLGWVQRHQDHPDVMIATEAAKPALDAFEAGISKHLNHAAFSSFGTVTVISAEAASWADDWALDAVTPAEKKAMAGMLIGAAAPLCRQLAGDMILAAIHHSSTMDAEHLRRTMSGPQSNFVPSQCLRKTWEDFHRLQVRQLFRLSLEALFWWTVGNLSDRPKSMEAIVSAFVGELPQRGEELMAVAWLKVMVPSGSGPTELMAHIQTAMANPAAQDLAASIVAGLAFCLVEASAGEKHEERRDRLPLWRARKEAAARSEQSVPAFLHHVFESWILAQHVYWSVGRGLADARAGGKTLLRLKVVLDEGGWKLAPGASRGSPPVPTPDRLETVLTLARESSVIGTSSGT
jgi:hypothetical protein